MTNDKVSIIVPVYNTIKYIEATIDSVVGQTYLDWELILVDDGSTDGTFECMEKYRNALSDERIRIVRTASNAGAAKARNFGLSLATGRYIAYLDADDLWSPDKLARQLQFAGDRQAGFVFTGYEFAREDGTGTGKIVKVPETMNYKQALKNTTIFTSTVLFDTKRIPISLLDMPEVKSEDTALWWKILRNGYTAFGLNENLVSYRRCGQTLSSNKLEALRRIWNLYRKTERLSVIRSAYNFVFWAIRAVLRRV